MKGIKTKSTQRICENSSITSPPTVL